MLFPVVQVLIALGLLKSSMCFRSVNLIKPDGSYYFPESLMVESTTKKTVEAADSAVTPTCKDQINCEKPSQDTLTKDTSTTGRILTDPIQSPKPHIIFILADDLGWNDVGFHGSNQIPTPNIDALAYGGVLLHNYYVQPICTPSRSALMTGKYPMRTGMQHSVLFGAEPRGLPLTEKLLPEYLQEMGYATRAVGKWHLGSWKKDYLPTSRGFLSHVGYWTGHQDYNDHTAMETGMWGVDMRRGLEVAYDLHGKHTTDVITDESIKIIDSHPIQEPLFLYIAHAAVHSGNPYNPLCALDEDVENFSNISDYKRQRFAGLLRRLDLSVGEVVNSLEKRGMLNNSIIVFSTDNGGPAGGFNLNAASNWPLRGVKNTPWEGGVRGSGLVWSPLIKERSRVHHNMFHLVDWLPTLLRAANASLKTLGEIDGVDQWLSLMDRGDSERTEILLNIDDKSNISSLRVGDWKIVQGTTYKGNWDRWFGPSGREGEYDVEAVQDSSAAQSLRLIGQEIPQNDKILELRGEITLSCSASPNATECHPLKAPCLFNIKADPCEYNNVASQHPRILRHLLERLDEYNKTAIPAANLPVDQRGNPKHWAYTWTNWGDYLA